MPSQNIPYLPKRRSLLGALATGALAQCAPKGYDIIRPPGSVPEQDFLALCLRCGACMRVCPTNALQPLWLQGGFLSVFSPFLDPRRGPCRPECVACGEVCPTNALLALPLSEKKWAKIGTAALDTSTCLAWADDKRCMVCKENCPYDAIQVTTIPGHTAPVPIVRPEACYGCGYCEKYCPKPHAAIKVRADGALRLSAPPFAPAAKAQGLRLHEHTQHTIPDESGVPPGFLE